jgi:NAD-dependent deacetylase sirtuin 5
VATREAFESEPELVWVFYVYKRQQALRAQPNAVHYALAELAKKMPGFMAVTENVDHYMLSCLLSTWLLHIPLF